MCSLDRFVGRLGDFVSDAVMLAAARTARQERTHLGSNRGWRETGANKIPPCVVGIGASQMAMAIAHSP